MRANVEDKRTEQVKIHTASRADAKGQSQHHSGCQRKDRRRASATEGKVHRRKRVSTVTHLKGGTSAKDREGRHRREGASGTATGNRSPGSGRSGAGPVPQRAKCTGAKGSAPPREGRHWRKGQGRQAPKGGRQRDRNGLLSALD